MKIKKDLISGNLSFVSSSLCYFLIRFFLLYFYLKLSPCSIKHNEHIRWRKIVYHNDFWDCFLQNSWHLLNTVTKHPYFEICKLSPIQEHVLSPYLCWGPLQLPDTGHAYFGIFSVRILNSAFDRDTVVCLVWSSYMAAWNFRIDIW